MMTSSVFNKLETLKERYQEVQALLGDPEIVTDQTRYRALMKEFSQLEDVVKTFNDFQQVQEDLNAAKTMLLEDDPELQDLAREEIEQATQKEVEIQHQLQVLLLPKDPHDSHSCFLEVRAGTGGDEAAIFAGDLFRMYSRFAESQNWPIEILSENEGEHGGYKEITRIGGESYGHLKFESVSSCTTCSETESQGRFTHQLVPLRSCLNRPKPMPEITTNDLRIDTFRASGAGGQHVNKTDSAIRITISQLVLSSNAKTSLSTQKQSQSDECAASRNNTKKKTPPEEQTAPQFTRLRDRLIAFVPQPSAGRATDHRIN